jgi:hypothetical protein
MKTLNINASETLRTNSRVTRWAFILLSIFALMSMAARAQVTYTPVFTNIWVVAPGTYADLPNTGNNVRGIAINPITTNILYASTTGGTNNGNNHVATLAFGSGSNYLANLDGTGFGAGTVATSGIRVSDDGHIYACNVSGAPASTFKIWRWDSDTDTSVAPLVVYNSGAGTSFQWRLGDYIDLRGSGSNTEIVVVGPGSGANITTNFVIFRPTDDTCTTFTNFSITIPGSSASLNLCGAGVAFEGTNNAIWIRRAGSQETRRISYDPVALTAVVTRTNNVDQSTCQGLKYYAGTNGVQLLATVQGNTGAGGVQLCRVFNLSASGSSGALVSVLSSSLTVPGFANGNGLGNVDFQKGYFVFGTPNNGISLYQLGFTTQSPPSTILAASASTIVAGYSETFTAAASGTPPLSYSWYYNTNTLIPSALTNVYNLPSVQTGNSGVYTVIVTNLYGATTNSTTITVLPNGASALTTNIWSLAPGSRPYLTTSDTQRGLGYDTNLNRLVLVTRSPTNGIILLDGTTGADAGNLDITALLALTPPGAYPINLCGVADDGIVYVANLITSADSDTFVIYSWTSADPSATIGQAYAGNPGGALGWTGPIGRIGDTMAVRGAGVNTEILCTFRNGTNVCVFTTSDGVNFTPHIVGITNLVQSIGSTDPFTAASPLGLGCAFGLGDTFWAKSTSYNLRLVSFDLASGNGAVIGNYVMPASEAPLGVDPQNGYAALVGVNEFPMNLSIYDITSPLGPTIGTLVDRELFAVSNANGNGTGAVVFDVAGGRIFSLSSNSGIIALSYAGRLALAQISGQQVLTWPTTASTLQSSTDVLGPYLDVAGAASPYTNSTDAQKFFRLKK